MLTVTTMTTEGYEFLSADDIAALHAATDRIMDAPANPQRDLVEEKFDDVAAGLTTWEEVASFCSYCCQMDSCELMPFEYPPVWLDLADIDDILALGRRGNVRYRGATLLREMRALDISAFEPDPKGAIAEAKRQMPPI
jgi:hypothetical protein